MTIIVEFDDPVALVRAAERLHRRGYRRALAITPFPLPELESFLDIPRTRLPYAVLAAGLAGTLTAFLIIWWTNAIDYPIDVGGRPLNSFVSDIPIMFETTVLFAALTAFTLFFLASRMPRLWDPWSEVAGIDRTTVDRYWLGIDPMEPVYHPDILDDMRALGAVVVRRAEESP